MGAVRSFQEVHKLIKNLKGPIYVDTDATYIVATGTKTDVTNDTGSGFLGVMVGSSGTRWIQLYE